MSMITPIIFGSTGSATSGVKSTATSGTDNIVSSNSDSWSPLTLKPNSSAGPGLQIWHKNSVEGGIAPTWEFKGQSIRNGPGTGAIDTTVITRAAQGLMSVGAGLSIGSTLATVSPLTVTGTKPSSVAGAGTAAQPITFTGGTGGDTSGTSTVGGGGGAVTIQSGTGGNAPSGSFSGQGGSINLIIGGVGAGGGAVTGPGALNIYSNSGSTGIEIGRTAGSTPGAQAPFIDFHYSPAGTWAAQDYNVRLQNTGDRIFSLLFEGGNSVVVNNGEAQFSNGVITKTKAGIPTGSEVVNSAVDGHLVVDTVNHNLYFRSGGTMRLAGGGSGGAGDDVATVDDLHESYTAAIVPPNNATTNYSIFIVQVPCLITAMSTIVPSPSLTTSDTAYYTVNLRRIRNNDGGVTMATKTTRVTGGAGWTAFTDWNFNIATVWTLGNATCQAGDLIQVQWVPTGAPTAVTAAPVHTVKYQPTA